MNKNKKNKNVKQNKEKANMEKNMDMGALDGISHAIESDIKRKEK